MTIHKSLSVASSLRRHRNVLTKSERLDKMIKQGSWKEGDSVFGLPKMSAGFKLKKGKGKAETEEKK